MAKSMGGALACPTSEANMGAVTFRTTREHETTVAMIKNTHDTMPKGMMQSMTAGTYGTKEYPYMHTHSTSKRACMLMHCVVSQRTMGTPKE